MKIYKSSKNTIKWYRKINWLRLLILALLSFGLTFLITNLMSSFNELGNTFKLSLVISFLVSLETILNDILENRDRIFFIKGNTISYIEIHSEKNVKVLSHYDYIKILEDNNIETVHDNIEKFEGIDKGKIIKLINIKRKYNRTIINAKVKVKEWTDEGKLTKLKMVLKDVEKDKKFIIMNDYNDYNELIDKINRL